jgi:hypothetical protein
MFIRVEARDVRVGSTLKTPMGAGPIEMLVDDGDEILFRVGGLPPFRVDPDTLVEVAPEDYLIPF